MENQLSELMWEEGDLYNKKYVHIIKQSWFIELL